MSTPLQAIIVDDESLARKGLNLRLKEIQGVFCIVPSRSQSKGSLSAKAGSVEQ